MHHPGLTTRIEVDLAVVMTGCHHCNSTPLKFFPNEPRQHEGLRGIAMQAQTVNRHRNQSTLDRHDGLIEQQPKLLSYAVLIFDNRSYLASRYQSTIGSVCPIGKAFLDHLQPCRLPYTRQRRSGQGIQQKRGVNVAHAPDNGFCDLLISSGHGIEGAMRLYMP